MSAPTLPYDEPWDKPSLVVCAPRAWQGSADDFQRLGRPRFLGGTLWPVFRAAIAKARTLSGLWLVVEGDRDVRGDVEAYLVDELDPAWDAQNGYCIRVEDREIILIRERVASREPGFMVNLVDHEAAHGFWRLRHPTEPGLDSILHTVAPPYRPGFGQDDIRSAVALYGPPHA